MPKTSQPLAIAIVLFIFGCAQIKPIPGGEKDLVPPRILKWIPENTQTKFTAKGFSIEFDEFVSLQNIQTELVVSPPLQTPPVVTVNKKRLTVQWKEELSANTTYNFQFGDGVVDINEANKVIDLNYVFSTGESLDSARCTFMVTNNLTGEPSKNVRIILFENDSAFFEARPKPAYISKTNENGTAQIKFMRLSNFYAYALDDVNANYRMDNGEQVGFLSSPFTSSATDSTIIKLNLCNALPETKRVENYLVDSTGTMRFYWPKAWGDIEVNSLTNYPIETWADPLSDTVWTFLQNSPTNEYVNLSITDNQTLKDTIAVPFFNQTIDRWSLVKATSKIKSNQPVLFEAPFAIKTISGTIDLQMSDSTTVQGFWTRGEAAHHVNLKGDFIPGKYHGLLNAGSFMNVSDIPNDSLSIDFQVLGPKDLGTLQVDLTGLKEGRSYYLEMLDAGGNVLQTWAVKSPSKLKLVDLIPGEFAMRLWEDKNNNGVPDLTDVRKKQEADPYTVLTKKVLIRANWEVQLLPSQLPKD
jgi:Bacterial Ig-like domain